MSIDDLIFIGIKGSALALDRSTGAIRWRANLKGGGFVNLVRDQELLLATTRGIVFCLDALSGQILWTNGLEGCGFGIATIVAGENVQQNTAAIAELEQQEQQAAAAATAPA